MNRSLIPAAALLLLAACDPDAVEKSVEKRAADAITKATGKEAAVDLTGDGGTVTVGDDRIDVTLNPSDVRRDPPADVPIPDGARVTSVIPGVVEDVIRMKTGGPPEVMVEAYDRKARLAGYLPVGTPLVTEGMVAARWRADGKPGLALFGFRTERGPVTLTLVVDRNRKR
ncbi:MAG: hypothetical protein HQK87_08985 [Nitrospinae bacterium]|nr:hypothetical protein [Nitrospinota bacterium]